MTLDIDTFLLLIFTVSNLVLGLWSSKGIKTIKEYSVGDRNFSTATLVATIVATWVSGSFFFNTLPEIYKNGLYYAFASIGPIISLLAIAYIFAPRMSRFLGKLSIADAMGDLYGENVRIITALASFVASSGRVAAQFKVSGLIFQYCMHTDETTGIILGSIVVIIYSSFGGIKSVTFTDFIQFITFGTIIPILVFYLLNEIDNFQDVFVMMTNNPTFDLAKVFDFNNPKSLYYAFLFLYMIAPSFDPPMFQRISMGKNIPQIKRAFLISALVFFALRITLFWIALLLLTTHPNMDPKYVTKHLIFEYSYTGFKGLILVAIMAMTMSTADSYVNCAAVTFIHDLVQPINKKLFGAAILKDELFASRIAAMLIGIAGLAIALRGESLLKIVIACNSFYMPVVSVPFTLALFGFVTGARSVIAGMVAGLLLVITWYIAGITVIDPVIPGMLVNLIATLCYHYLTKEPGGWEPAGPNEKSNVNRHANKWTMNRFRVMIGKFSIMRIIERSAPTSSTAYIAVGLYCTAMIYTIMHTIPVKIKHSALEEIKFIMFTSLVASTLLLSHPLWLWKKRSRISGVIWHFVIFYVLVCVPFGFVLISHFAMSQLMIFMINLVIIAGLVRWQMSMLMIPSGILITIKSLEFTINSNAFLAYMDISSQLLIIYMLLVFTGVIVVIFRPKQEYIDLSEEKIDYLETRIDQKDNEVQEALSLKSEFIRNVQHEYNAPMTGIISLAEGLHDAYEKLNDDTRKDSIMAILDSARRFSDYDSNIVTLARLSKPNYSLNLEKVNLSKLLFDRIGICKKIYYKPDELDLLVMELNIYPNIYLTCDKNYISQLIDNLISNAFRFGRGSKISIELNINSGGEITLSVEDEGMGVPARELAEIFEPFTVSSLTKSRAGGRGVGLAVCKKIADVHNASIWADNKDKGIRFCVSFRCNTNHQL
ncbi:MAG: ATP-binding protein [Rickettsiaceae bacterium]|nr:ATP-binding protein [Rickettsiaceae bacterium]